MSQTIIPRRSTQWQSGGSKSQLSNSKAYYVPPPGEHGVVVAFTVVAAAMIVVALPLVVLETVVVMAVAMDGSGNGDLTIIMVAMVAIPVTIVEWSRQCLWSHWSW